jgi:hypothetical protein
MKKVKLYVKPAKQYYKLMRKPSFSERAKNDIGVLYFDKHNIMIQRAEESIFTDSKYADRLTDCPKTEYTYSYNLPCESKEEAFKILNDLFDVEELAPHERISQTIALPVEVVNLLKKARKNVRRTSKEDHSYRELKHLKGEVFNYRNSTIEVKDDDIVVVDDQKEFTSLAAAARYISSVSVNIWVTFKTSEGVTPDEMCRNRSNYKESTVALGEMREFPVSDHVLAWLEKIK